MPPLGHFSLIRYGKAENAHGAAAEGMAAAAALDSFCRRFLYPGHSGTIALEWRGSSAG